MWVPLASGCLEECASHWTKPFLSRTWRGLHIYPATNGLTLPTSRTHHTCVWAFDKESLYRGAATVCRIHAWHLGDQLNMASNIMDCVWSDCMNKQWCGRISVPVEQERISSYAILPLNNHNESSYATLHVEHLSSKKLVNTKRKHINIHTVSSSNYGYTIQIVKYQQNNYSMVWLV